MNIESIIAGVDEAKERWERNGWPLAFVVSADIAELVKQRVPDARVWYDPAADGVGTVMPLHADTAVRLAGQLGWTEQT